MYLVCAQSIHFLACYNAGVQSAGAIALEIVQFGYTIVHCSLDREHTLFAPTVVAIYNFRCFQFHCISFQCLCAFMFFFALLTLLLCYTTLPIFASYLYLCCLQQQQPYTPTTCFALAGLSACAACICLQCVVIVVVFLMHALMQHPCAYAPRKQRSK